MVCVIYDICVVCVIRDMYKCVVFVIYGIN